MKRVLNRFIKRITAAGITLIEAEMDFGGAPAPAGYCYMMPNGRKIFLSEEVLADFKNHPERETEMFDMIVALNATGPIAE
jgi:hypothetical protein